MEILPNGAIAVSKTKIRDGFLVLAVNSRGENVTWVTDEKMTCFSGHYFGTDQLTEAVKDFQERLSLY